MEANFFTVEGAEATNEADSGVITAVFPETESTPDTPTYGISLSSTDTHVFTTAEPDYAAQTPLTVTVTNTGNQATGDLTVALSGTNAASFTLSTTSISSIAVGGTSSFTVAPAAGLAVGSYTAVVTVSGSNGITAGFNVSFAVETPIPYIIAGSGEAFTATRETATVGTADQPIQDVINAIRRDAAGKSAIIQFGDEADVLDIGTANITFNAADDGIWGAVTLSGKITSNVTTANSGVIVITGAVSVTSTADIANTGSRSAIYNNSTDTVTITDGTISATTGQAVYNSYGSVTITGGTLSAAGQDSRAVYNYSGTLTITGGTLSVTGLNSSAVYNNYGSVTITGGTISKAGNGAAAIYNITTNTVKISGGTISATGQNGRAVYNDSTGKIIVSGTALVTSANTSATRGTIYLRSNGTATDVRLEITGGTVENTSTTTGNAIYNASAGAVSITGGTVSKAGSTGNAIYNNSTGVVTIGEGATIVGDNYGVE